MSTFDFTPWKPVRVSHTGSPGLREIGELAKKIFKAGFDGSHSGRVYKYGKASAPGEYPANKSGATKGSIRYVISGDTITLGTSSKAAGYLRNGTRRMARRKMSDSALTEAVEALGVSHRVRFTHG